MFTVTPTYSLPIAEEESLLNQLVVRVRETLSLPISGWRRVSSGQNPTYMLFIDGEPQPRYLLKIPIRKGYPAVASLHICYDLLRQAGLGDYRIVYHDDGDEIVPYGYFVQTWLAGTALDPNAGNDGDVAWLADFLAVLKKVHRIPMPNFGYLANGPQYTSLHDYFVAMDEVIDHSFGDVLVPGASIWDLEEQGFTSPGFLTATFTAVHKQAERIHSSVTPVLLHGDMLPGNLLYTANGPMLIDWDESRAGWWLYDVARMLYYLPFEEGLAFCLDHYDIGTLSQEEIRLGIRLEHVRQSLREMCIGLFNESDRAQVRAKVQPYETKISGLLGQTIL